MLEKVRGLPKAIGRVVEKPSFPATKNKQRNWRNDISLPFLPKLSKLDPDQDTYENQKSKLHNNNHVLMRIVKTLKEKVKETPAKRHQSLFCINHVLEIYIIDI